MLAGAQLAGGGADFLPGVGEGVVALGLAGAGLSVADGEEAVGELDRGAGAAAQPERDAAGAVDPSLLQRGGEIVAGLPGVQSSIGSRVPAFPVGLIALERHEPHAAALSLQQAIALQLCNPNILGLGEALCITVRPVRKTVLLEPADAELRIGVERALALGEKTPPRPH